MFFFFFLVSLTVSKRCIAHLLYIPLQPVKIELIRGNLSEALATLSYWTLSYFAHEMSATFCTCHSHRKQTYDETGVVPSNNENSKNSYLHIGRAKLSESSHKFYF